MNIQKDKLEVIHDWVNQLKDMASEELSYSDDDEHEDEERFLPNLFSELCELDEYIEKHKEGIRSGI